MTVKRVELALLWILILHLLRNSYDFVGTLKVSSMKFCTIKKLISNVTELHNKLGIVKISNIVGHCYNSDIEFSFNTNYLMDYYI